MTPPTSLPFSPEDFNFCRNSLVRVSRTFALNIKVLDGELHKSVLLCYLLCRIIDTVEDCPDRDAVWKSELLLTFPRFLREHDHEGLQRWISRALEGDSKPAERELVDQTERVLRGYWSLPQALRMHVETWVSEMAGGMALYSKRFSLGQKIVLRDRDELEEYCYFVAGTVGRYLTESFITFYDLATDTAEKLRVHAVSFGLGLQFTNIAKDVIEDRQRGWTYLPESYLERHSVTLDDFMKLNPRKRAQIERAYLDLLDDALSHLKDALRYTLELPRNLLRLRLFCLWPLFMALETLIELKDRQRQLMEGAKVKISRRQVKTIIAATTLMGPFDDLIVSYFQKKLDDYEMLSAIE